MIEGARPAGIAGSDRFFDYLEELRETAAYDPSNFSRDSGSISISVTFRIQIDSRIVRKQPIQTIFQ